MTMNASQRLADIEASDTINWYNGTGSDTANNQLVFIAGQNATEGMVGISVGIIKSTYYGPVITKMKVQLPQQAVAITQGYMVYAATAGTGVSITTASGSYSVGVCTDTTASTAGYVNVDLNVGPTCFKIW
jgi:hypothetical protein